jgi:hypothetical protein
MKRVYHIEHLLTTTCSSNVSPVSLDLSLQGEECASRLFSKVDPSRFQVIVATHSPFALGIPGANYIEMTPGYLRECLTAAQRFVDRLVPGQRDIV